MSSTIKPEHRELYAKISLHLGLPEFGHILPHAASRASKTFLSSSSNYDLETMSLSEMARAALDMYEQSGANVTRGPPSPQQKIADAEAQAIKARAGRVLSLEEKRIMEEEYAKTMFKPRKSTAITAASLTWSPMKPFTAPPKSKLRAPVTGLWVDLLNNEIEKAQNEKEEKSIKALEKTSLFKDALDQQMNERFIASEAKRREDQAIFKAVQAEKAALRRDLRIGGKEKAIAKMNETKKAAEELREAIERKQKEKESSVAEARQQVEENARKLAEETAAKLAKVRAKQAEIAQFKLLNESELAMKKIKAMEEKAEAAEYAKRAIEAMEIAEAQRKAATIERQKEIEQKMSRMSGVFEAASNNQKLLDEKAEREKKLEEEAADARAAAATKARADLELACSIEMKKQIKEKIAREKASAAEARLLQVEFTSQAREAKLAAKEASMKRRETGLQTQTELQKQIIYNALKVITPDVSEFELSVNKKFLTRQKNS
jgi:hypothetical protein